MWRYVAEIIVASKVDNPSTIFFQKPWWPIASLLATRLNASLGLKIPTLLRHAGASRRQERLSNCRCFEQGEQREEVIQAGI